MQYISVGEKCIMEGRGERICFAYGVYWLGSNFFYLEFMAVNGMDA